MKEFDPRTSPMSGDMSSDRTKNADGTHAVSRTANGIEHTVVVVEQKRKLYTAQRKLELVRLTYLPGNTVSSVARSYGIAPALLFRWRSLDKQGGLTAIETGQSSLPAKQYAEAIDEIKRLQRLREELMAREYPADVFLACVRHKYTTSCSQTTFVLMFQSAVSEA